MPRIENDVVLLDSEDEVIVSRDEKFVIGYKTSNMVWTLVFGNNFKELLETEIHSGITTNNFNKKDFVNSLRINNTKTFATITGYALMGEKLQAVILLRNNLIEKYPQIEKPLQLSKDIFEEMFLNQLP